LGEYCEEVAAIPLNGKLAAVRGLVGLLRGGTVTESFYRRAAMRRTLQRWCEGVAFDVVVAYSSSMAPYALRVPTKRRVLDLCDRDSQKWLDYAAASSGPAARLYRTEGNRMAIREKAWVGAFDATILITELEAAPLRTVAGSGKIHVVGNGVSLPELTAPVAGGPPTVGFVGVMDYRPNVDAVCWFVSECWGELREAHPNAVFRVVGRSPTRRIRELSKVPGVQVVGGVDDIRPELQRLDVSVAPLRIARGLQNKVLEAMAAAKPVVLSSGAAAGIDACPERDYLIADTPDQFIRGVRRLLRDPIERQRMGQAARQFVANRHRWDDAVRKFELVVVGVIDRPNSPLGYEPARMWHRFPTGAGRG
jgi:sugar transferase (PEP-CTERM/EpsH1 system associated)